ncbi:hypothetical protein CI109_104462 [Kwoniella shandongensis]|uniref:Amidohydrolase 3 domain-containing protein n=1 Tax=Kwoniella shandongensis TaxID=1734106 RepID=A0A5M6BN90_9TREE|nr:uncharacterized protein CI109_007312 [Kwoniella shandongensis]KAA5524364.1 hypothetical protein CI109_007312 [Kwoniella shandongensis]
MSTHLFTNGRIFTSVEGDDTLHSSLLVRGDRIEFVGDAKELEGKDVKADQITDLQGAVVLPGIIDAHTHLMMFGASQDKIDMLGKSATEVQQLLLEARKPSSTCLLGRSFLFDALGEKPHRKILDKVVSDIPVFIDSADVHSCWLNSKAIETLSIDKHTEAPPGGEFQKDENGELTGLFLETAVSELVWPYVASLLSLNDRLHALDNAFDAYLATGVVGVVDMAMTEEDLNALEEYQKRRSGGLPINIAAHWLVSPVGTSEEREASVRAAAAHRDRLAKIDISLRIAGIKLISDGVVDSCTAYLTKPYANGALPGPIWPMEKLKPVVALADSLSLQVAVHAIGDAASIAALDAFEHAIAVNPQQPEPRFRIEHLEVVSEESIKRLTKLGVVASLQPVHADPIYLPNWREQLGQDERCDRAFPWTEYHHSHVAFGSDAPTAPHHSLPNLYTATTRRSAVDPTLPEPTDPRILSLDRFNLKLQTAIRYYTSGSAYSMQSSDRKGTLAVGKDADFCVLSIDPFANGVETLREAQQGVLETWLAGKSVWKRQEV